jgi:hypothetical protein
MFPLPFYFFQFCQLLYYLIRYLKVDELRSASLRSIVTQLWSFVAVERSTGHGGTQRPEPNRRLARLYERQAEKLVASSAASRTQARSHVPVKRLAPSGGTSLFGYSSSGNPRPSSPGCCRSGFPIPRNVGGRRRASAESTVAEWPRAEERASRLVVFLGFRSRHGASRSEVQCT